MSIAAKYEYFRAIYHRYHSASKQQKQIILDEFCSNCNYNRKYAIRTILRHKGYSFINVVGLAIGMTCCRLILMWVLDEFSV